MLQLKDTRFSNTNDFLKHAIATATFYGFAPLERVAQERRKAPRETPRPTMNTVRESELLIARRDERALLSAARLCTSANLGSREAIFAWRVLGSAARGTAPSTALELHILGIPSAIAEAILITVANSIIGEAGMTNRTVSINSIGTPDSSNRYIRDVGSFLRKHIESISPALRPRAAEDPLGTLIQLIERGHPAASRAPQSMEYLTEEERRRFWDLLEYLEVAGTPYELNAHILGSRDLWAHTLFDISWRDEESGTRIPIARGGRYDPLVSRFLGTSSSGASVTIMCEARGRPNMRKLAEEGEDRAFYFAHLGPEARRKMIPTLEMLRREEILVHQSLMYERIGEQMAAARRLNTPYILIMGHKEAVENTVLVREIATNSQRAVLVDELPGYLKRHKIRI